MKAISALHRPTHLNPRVMAWVRRYFIAVGVLALACAHWKYPAFFHAANHGTKSSIQAFETVVDLSSYALTLVLLLSPWWRLGDLVPAISYAIALPACVYALLSLFIVDLIHLHPQAFFHGFLLTGVLAQIYWLLIPLRAESRQVTIAHQWKQQLRGRHAAKIELVERFILEIEGEERDITRWSRFAGENTGNPPMSMWKRLDLEWEKRSKGARETATEMSGDRPVDIPVLTV